MAALEEVGYRGALVVESLLKPSPRALFEFPRRADRVLAS